MSNLLDNQGVEVAKRAQLGQWRGLKVLLLMLSSDGISVSKDEVDLVRTAALVRSKHDGVRCVIRELFELDTLWRFGEQLHVCSTTLQSILSLHLVP